MSLVFSATMPAKILSLNSILLILTNLVPLIGVIWWGWDVFLLLMLYWMETAIIAFWAYVGIATMPKNEDVLDRTLIGRISSRIGQLIFFGLNSGIFMSVHFTFLWVLFSGAWANEVHDPEEFLRVIVLRTGLWVPLIFMFLVRGFSFGLERFGFAIERTPASPGASTNIFPDSPVASGVYHRYLDAGSIVSGLYSRIVVMHLVIIFGGFLTLAAAPSFGPIVLLVLLKTVADVGLFAFWKPKT